MWRDVITLMPLYEPCLFHLVNGRGPQARQGPTLWCWYSNEVRQKRLTLEQFELVLIFSLHVPTYSVDHWTKENGLGMRGNSPTLIVRAGHNQLIWIMSSGHFIDIGGPKENIWDPWTKGRPHSGNPRPYTSRRLVIIELHKQQGYCVTLESLGPQSLLFLRYHTYTVGQSSVAVSCWHGWWPIWTHVWPWLLVFILLLSRLLRAATQVAWKKRVIRDPSIGLLYQWCIVSSRQWLSRHPEQWGRKQFLSFFLYYRHTDVYFASPGLQPSSSSFFS